MRGLADLVAPLVDDVVDHLGDPGVRVLDLGAGVAPWTRALAARHHHAEITAVDLPEVIGLTAAAVEEDGLSDRFRFVAGDLLTVELAGPFDLVLAAAVCRLFGEDDNRRLARRLAGLLAPGGTLVILDALPAADRPGGGPNDLYALGLALRTGRGGIHPLSMYAAWLYDAGFVHIEAHQLGVPELSLIRASRPG